MSYLHDILNLINANIAQALACDRAQVLGLAKLIKRDNSDKKTGIWPAVLSSDGDAAYAGPDDRFDITTYHRSLSMSANRLPGGYGDSAGRVRVTHAMAMVLCVNPVKTGWTNEDLSFKIFAALPGQLKKDDRPAGTENVTITVTGVILNEEQVFNEEFKNVDYFISPEQSLMKVNYQIESTLPSVCFNKLCQS